MTVQATPMTFSGQQVAVEDALARGALPDAALAMPVQALTAPGGGLMAALLQLLPAQSAKTGM